MMIKICGLTERQNITEIVALRPEWIGLIFYPASPRYAGNDKTLAAWLRTITGSQKVGVFVNEGELAIRDAIAAYGLDLVQLHGKETPGFCARIRHTVPVIKAFALHEDFDFSVLKAYAGACDYFLFDTPAAGYGGSGKHFDWDLLQQGDISLPFLLSGGIGPDDLAPLKRFRHKQGIGIDVNSRFEDTPGVKNYELLKTFIHEIRN
jgi:phosphoribosylanthranilate isomerase